jgi:GT2 family glycosyltransferase
LGFGAGHDRAIRDGNSEYCLVTNLDLEFAPNSLCDVLRVALSDTDGAVASWELRQIPYEHPKYYDPVTLETHWSSHACILIRRNAYNKVGGYDPYIFMYAEDVELSYRFRSYGYVLKYVPAAVVSHFTYDSAGQVKPLQFSGGTIGNIYIRLRYGSTADRLAGLSLYLARIILPSPFDGARSLLLKNAFKLLSRLPHFLRGKGDVPAYFPLRGFDYEVARDGAFYEVQPCAATEATPLVTVITRTYKGRSMFLEQAVQSVFNQTYPAIELLVVEDGGDSQQALVTSLAERAPSGCRVRFLSNEKLGRSAAGNAGLAAAAGRFLMFLDDDDLLFADHVEMMVSALSLDPTLSAAYALSIEVHTQVDLAMSRYVEDAFHTPAVFRQEWDYDVLLDHNFIPIQAILFKRELYEQRGGFDTELDQLEDWNLWLRYGYGNRFVYVPKTTSLFRTPADHQIRSARHALLHNDYYAAKGRAASSLEQLERHH